MCPSQHPDEEPSRSGRYDGSGPDAHESDPRPGEAGENAPLPHGVGVSPEAPEAIKQRIRTGDQQQIRGAKSLSDSQRKRHSVLQERGRARVVPQVGSRIVAEHPGHRTTRGQPSSEANRAATKISRTNLWRFQIARRASPATNRPRSASGRGVRATERMCSLR